MDPEQARDTLSCFIGALMLKHGVTHFELTEAEMEAANGHYIALGTNSTNRTFIAVLDPQIENIPPKGERH